MQVFIDTGSQRLPVHTLHGWSQLSGGFSFQLSFSTAHKAFSSPLTCVMENNGVRKTIVGNVERVVWRSQTACLIQLICPLMALKQHAFNTVLVNQSVKQCLTAMIAKLDASVHIDWQCDDMPRASWWPQPQTNAWDNLQAFCASSGIYFFWQHDSATPHLVFTNTLAGQPQVNPEHATVQEQQLNADGIQQTLHTRDINIACGQWLGDAGWVGRVEHYWHAYKGYFNLTHVRTNIQAPPQPVPVSLQWRQGTVASNGYVDIKANENNRIPIASVRSPLTGMNQWQMRIDNQDDVIVMADSEGQPHLFAAIAQEPQVDVLYERKDLACWQLSDAEKGGLALRAGKATWTVEHDGVMHFDADAIDWRGARLHWQTNQSLWQSSTQYFQFGVLEWLCKQTLTFAAAQARMTFQMGTLLVSSQSESQIHSQHMLINTTQQLTVTATKMQLATHAMKVKTKNALSLLAKDQCCLHFAGGYMLFESNGTVTLQATSINANGVTGVRYAGVLER